MCTHDYFPSQCRITCEIFSSAKYRTRYFGAMLASRQRALHTYPAVQTLFLNRSTIVFARYPVILSHAFIRSTSHANGCWPYYCKRKNLRIYVPKKRTVKTRALEKAKSSRIIIWVCSVLHSAIFAKPNRIPWCRWYSEWVKNM